MTFTSKIWPQRHACSGHTVVHKCYVNKFKNIAKFWKQINDIIDRSLAFDMDLTTFCILFKQRLNRFCVQQF